MDDLINLLQSMGATDVKTGVWHSSSKPIHDSLFFTFNKQDIRISTPFEDITKAEGLEIVIEDID